MSDEKHPLIEEFSDAHDHLLEAMNRLAAEVRKGERGLVKAAKLDLDKAQDAYNEVCDRL
jgi:enoyl-CoA hydratase/carnithine racemase